MPAHPTAAHDRPAVESPRATLTRLPDLPDLPLPELFRRVCEAAADALRVERAGIWLFVTGDKVLRCVSLFERSKRRHGKGTCLSLAEFPSFLRAVSAAQLLPCEAARSDPRTAELRDPYLAPLGITSVLDAPLVRDGRLVGVVCHEHVGPPREWTDDDRAFALRVAELVVNRMKAAEGALWTGPQPRFVVPSCQPPNAAHDLRNLLSEILAGAELIARTPGLSPGVADRLDRIADAARRGAALVRELFEQSAGKDADTAEHETLPEADFRTVCTPAPGNDDTGEHQPLPPG